MSIGLHAVNWPGIEKFGWCRKVADVVCSVIEEVSMESVGLWLTPLVLLPGVAILLISTSARYGEIHAEFHRLLGQSDHSDAAQYVGGA